MSTTSPTQTAKRGRPRVKKGKVRQNISIDPDTLKKARRMAFDDGLMLSTWIARLVEKKFENITGKAGA